MSNDYLTVLEIEAVIAVIDQEGMRIPPAMTIYRKRQLVEAVRDKLAELQIVEVIDDD